MNASTFLNQFEHLAEAPNGIAKLRELILQLAVRGKLVPQDPDDEPASELLKRVESEKRRLIGEGALRKGKSWRPIELERAPYELPSGWQWARLVDLGEICGGGTPSKNHQEYWNGGIPWISPKDMKADLLVDSEMDVSPLALEETVLRLIPAGSVLFVGRSGILRRMLPVAVNSVPCTVNQDLKVVIPYGNGLSTYVRLMLKGHERFILETFVKQGTTVQSLVYDELLTQPFGFAPLAEQKRIVAKVDELMALCDDLEAKRQAKRSKKIALNRASLHTLTEPSRDSLTAAWYRIRDHFANLYTAPETVADLRQTILQLAVMGRLVPQDPLDLPASELLKKIQAEKQRLIAERIIPKTKSLEATGLEENPYDLPENWIWTRLGEIGRTQTGTTPKKSDVDSYGDDIPFLKPGDISWGRVDYGNDGLSRLGAEKHGRMAASGSSLMVCIGTIGKTQVIDRDCSFNQQINAVTPFRGVDPALLQWFLRSPYFQDAAWARASSTTISILNKGKWQSIPLPLPPLAEQKRIVAKVDQLMTLCDDLDTKLQQAQTDADNLLTAIVHELTWIGANRQEESLNGK